MTSFVTDSGEYLDYSGEDFGMTKQVATWHDFKLKGDLSVDFKIPNTTKNRNTLNYYGAQQIDSPAFPSIPFNVIRNGNLLVRGYLVIKTSTEDEINVFFVSGNSNWFNALQFKLNEIDFADSYSVLSTDAITLKSATDGIIFPLVDWFANGQHRSTLFVEPLNQNQLSGPAFSEWFPCIYLHTVLSQLCKHGGIKISGDLIKDPLFIKMVMTPNGPDLYWPDWAINETALKVYHKSGVIIYDDTADPQLVQWAPPQEIPELNVFTPSDYSWTIPRTAAYQIDFGFGFLPNTTYKIYLYVNGALNSTIYTGGDTSNKVKYKAFTKGQKIQFYVERTVGSGGYRVLVTSYISVKIAKPIGNYLPTSYYGEAGSTPYICPQAIVGDMKATDFIKFICIYFGAVCSYDENSKTLGINKFSKMLRSNAEDWSEYFVSQKTIFQTGVSNHNYIQTEEGPEEQIESYNAQAKIKYGGGDLQTEFDISFERDLYKIPFGLSWDQENITENNLFLPYVKFFDLTLDEQASYSAVGSYGDVSGATLAQFTATFQSALSWENVYFVKSNSGEYTGWTSAINISGTTNPVLCIPYGSSDTGTIAKYTVTKVTGPNRLLIVRPEANVSDANGSTVYYQLQGGLSYGSMTTACLAWSDKPKINGTLDLYTDSLCIDPVNNRSYNYTIGERFHQELENIYRNPKVEAYFLLPVDVFYTFNFGTFVYLKTRDVTGYFFVQKIDNYKDPVTPVKVELLCID